MNPRDTGHSRIRAVVCGIGLAIGSMLPVVASAADGPRAFQTAELAVAALAEAAQASDVQALLALFGPGGTELAASSDSGYRPPEPGRVRRGDEGGLAPRPRREPPGKN